MQILSTWVSAWDSLVLPVAVGDTAAVEPSSAAGCSRVASVAEPAWAALLAFASVGAAVGTERRTEAPPSFPGSLPPAVALLAAVSGAPGGCKSVSARGSSSASASAAWPSAAAAAWHSSHRRPPCAAVAPASDPSSSSEKVLPWGVPHMVRIFAAAPAGLSGSSEVSSASSVVG